MIEYTIYEEKELGDACYGSKPNLELPEDEKLKYANAIFDGNWRTKHIFCVATFGKLIVGVIKIKVGGETSFNSPEFFNWVNFVSVHNDYHNRGISKRLVELGFSELKSRGYDHILISGYSSYGFAFLRKTVKATAEKFNLRFKDEDRIGFPDRIGDTCINEKNLHLLTS